ncbi:glyco 3-alpha-L-fucosyltransferase A-like [Brachionus plicatilis]|uniref:Fucosyltransferase n=1 Tax=Brachionus plicatilis TaxID=10195 RepID=A0A3M7R4V1_BRAPC|nr:glyco 3-alpha-L-fucosyltransferase A-like [Brachionus plicatilis]
MQQINSSNRKSQSNNLNVPKSGFINVLDYKNTEELSQYLKYLDQNKTAYNSYFKWKKYVLFKDRLVHNNFCDMCLMLNLENEMPIHLKQILFNSFFCKSEIILNLILNLTLALLIFEGQDFISTI